MSSQNKGRIIAVGVMSLLLFGAALLWIPQGPALPPGLTLAQSSNGNRGSSSTGSFNGAQPQLTLGANGGAAGQLAWAGSTSGTATCTAPAIAGTSTNPVTCSNVFALPDGATATVSYGFTGAPNWGTYRNAAVGVIMTVAGNDSLGVRGGLAGVMVPSAGGYGFTNGTVSGTVDTDIGRAAAGVATVDGGTIGDTKGKLKASGYMSAGTKFTSNAGCTEGTLVGGATAGKFTVGQNTACTIIITMGDTATAPNGWTCTAYDQTAVPAVAIRQTASNATTCSLLMTVAISDVITFSAIGF